MPTVAGLRRRGYTKEAIWNSPSRLGYPSKAERPIMRCSKNTFVRIEESTTPMAVIDPLLVTITIIRKARRMGNGRVESDNESQGERPIRLVANSISNEVI